MDIDVGDTERKVTQERINFIDKLTPNPQERAAKVWEVITEYNQANPDMKLDNWDLLCYSVTHLVMLANVFTWLRTPAKHLKNLVFNAHYLYPNGHGIIKDDK